MKRQHRWEAVMIFGGLALASPFYLFPQPDRPLFLLPLLTVPLIAWWLLRSAGDHLETPFNTSLLLLNGMVLVSLWATFDIRFSLPKVSGMVFGMGVFLAVTHESVDARRWQWALTVYLGLGTGVALISLLGTRWFQNKILLLIPLTSRLPRLLTLPGAEQGLHPNEVAGALTWVLPVGAAWSLGLLSSARGWQARLGGLLVGGATLFMGGVFLLTQSRGGYIGLAVALLVMLGLALPARGRRVLIVLVLVAALLGAGLLARTGLEPLRAWLEQSDALSPNAVSLNSLESRLEIWSRAIYGIQDFPFTGMGMNAFRKVVHVLYPLFRIGPDVDIGHAHNEFLQAALDLGIPGLIAFLSLYLIAFWLLQEAWRACNPQTPALRQNAGARAAALHWPRYRAITLGLFGGLLAHLLYGLTDAISLGAKPGFLFWMLLGLIVGLQRQI